MEICSGILSFYPYTIHAVFARQIKRTLINVMEKVLSCNRAAKQSYNYRLQCNTLKSRDRLRNIVLLRYYIQRFDLITCDSESLEVTK